MRFFIILFTLLMSVTLIFLGGIYLLASFYTGEWVVIPLLIACSLAFTIVYFSALGAFVIFLELKKFINNL